MVRRNIDARFFRAFEFSQTYFLCHFQVKRNVDTNSETDVKVKEQAILDLGELLAATGQAEGKTDMVWKN